MNPSNGKVIARVKGASKAEYEATVQAMLKVKDQWQTTPAPRRGDIVREIGMELRKHKVSISSKIVIDDLVLTAVPHRKHWLSLSA